MYCLKFETATMTTTKTRSWANDDDFPDDDCSMASNATENTFVEPCDMVEPRKLEKKMYKMKCNFKLRTDRGAKATTHFVREKLCHLLHEFEKRMFFNCKEFSMSDTSKINGTFLASRPSFG